MKNISVKIVLCNDIGEELDVTKDIHGNPFTVENIVLEEDLSSGQSKLMVATRTMNFRFSPKPKNNEEVLKFLGASFV